MITNTYLVWSLGIAAGILAVLAMIRPFLGALTLLWMRGTRFGRFVFVLAAGALCAFAGTKNDATNPPMSNPPPRMLMRARAQAPVLFAAPAGYDLIAAFADNNHDFAATIPAITNTDWSAHGAYEAWHPFSSYVAFTGGYLRPSPRDSSREFGYHETDYLAAIPGLSTFWWGTTNGTLIATWQDFCRGANTNDLISVQIELDRYHCLIRANDQARLYGKIYEPTNDASLVLTLAAPPGVIRAGDRRPISIAMCSSNTILGTLKFDCPEGADYVRFYSNSDDDEPVTLPLEWDAADFTSAVLYVGYAATSEAVDDIHLTLTLTGTEGSAGATVQADMTAVEIRELNLSSPYAQDENEAGPPFAAGNLAEFDVEKSKGHADPHLLIPFYRVLYADTFGVRNFSVHAALDIRPSGYREAVSWSTLEGTPTSGSLVQTGVKTADYQNPKVGGVYRLSASLGGLETQGTFILPLAGASVDEVLEDDISTSTRFCNLAKNRLPKIEYQRVAFGYYFFCLHSTGYYRGRPNNSQSPTVWAYNGIETDSGLGAICTLGGRPLYLEKLSNFLAGYVCKKIGVTPREAWAAQLFGTANNPSAGISWMAGESLAAPFPDPFSSSISTMAEDIWESETEPKPRKLWPNLAFADNHRTGRVDFDHYFSSPGMLNTSVQEFRIPDELAEELCDQLVRHFFSELTPSFIDWLNDFFTETGD